MGRKFAEQGQGVCNSNWKGGRSTRSGYTIILTRSDGYQYEHVLLMEQRIGRPLKRYGPNHKDNEVVHHIDGDKMNNEMTNLQMLTHGEHSTIHNNERLINDPSLRYFGVNVGRISP